MQQSHRFVAQIAVLLGDMLLLNLSFLLAAYLRFEDLQIRETVYYDYYIQLLLLVNLAWLMLSLLFKTHYTGLRPEARKNAAKVLNVLSLHIFLLLLLLVSLKRSDLYSRLFLVYFYLFAGSSILFWHFSFMRLWRALRLRGKGGLRVVFVGSGRNLDQLKKLSAEQAEYGLDVVAHFSGQEEGLEEKISRLQPEELYASFPLGDPRWVEWRALADRLFSRYRMVPDLQLEFSTKLRIDFLERIPILLERNEPLNLWHNRALKRLLDMLLSALILLTLMPLLLLVFGPWLALSGEGIFYTQQRAGLNGQAFWVVKFRSMNGQGQLTPLGRFLRRHSLDEFPQFWNVLKGEMSVVGPRPHMLEHTDEFAKRYQRFMIRHFVRPGITGLAQIKGFRGEVESDRDLEERVLADVYYIENWSFLLDLRILITTFFQVLFPTAKAK